MTLVVLTLFTVQVSDQLLTHLMKIFKQTHSPVSLINALLNT